MIAALVMMFGFLVLFWLHLLLIFMIGLRFITPTSTDAKVSVSLAGGRLDDQVLSLLRLNPWLAAAGIGVSIPIYEGGALQAQIKIATAQQAQAVARYGRVVLTAFREVEGALTNERLLANRLPLEENANRDRIEAVRIATAQYRGGKRDLLWVSNLQSQQIVTEAGLVKLRGEQRVNRARLLQALGASFEVVPAATPDQVN